jgi:hypothetical protein
MSEVDTDQDPGYRSRSQSRRRRRQQQRAKGAGQSQAQSMASVSEDSPPQQLNNPAASSTTEMQPFERIPPPSKSMNGPVTYARAMRGEIPMRDAQGNNMPQQRPPQQAPAKAPAKDMMEQDGLKLRLELNLDIEIELKASIHGDLTLAIVN